MIRRHLTHRVLPALFACVLIAFTGTSCAVRADLNELPIPGESVTGGYPLVLQFASVLNLPARAKVVMDGSVIGSVDSVTVRPSHVDVDTTIRSDVSVPADISAGLQQDTILGDIYIALVRPPGSTGVALAPGGVIPLRQTVVPAPLEDTLAVLAMFFTSGSVERIQRTITGVNAVTPAGTPQVRRLADRTATDLRELAGDLASADRWLRGVADTTSILARKREMFAHYASPFGMRGWDRTTYNSTYIATILPSIGSIYQGGFWLVPLYNALADAAGAVTGDGKAVLAQLPDWFRLLVKATSTAKYPALDIVSLSTADGRDRLPEIERVLRILGAIA